MEGLHCMLESKQIELKKCPFCGGRAKRKSAKYNIHGTYGSIEDNRQWYGVYCTQCRVGQPMRVYMTREESDTAWNTRKA